jgi:hypothetical protein
MPEYDYTISVSTEQAILIQNALDLYTRVIAGQVQEVSYQIASNRPDLSEKDLIEIRTLCNELKKHVSTNFSGVPDEAYDIMQVIRSGVAWGESPEGGDGVKFHKPFFRAGKKLARIEKNI